MIGCTYCGQPAEHRDHVVPCAVRGVRVYTDPTVPACLDCNSRILNDRPLFNVEDRRSFVLGALRARLARLPDTRWTEDELADLGPQLRRRVRQRLRARRKLIERIAFAAC